MRCSLRASLLFLAAIFASHGLRAEESKDHRPPHKIIAPTGSEFTAAMDRYHKWGDDAATKLSIKFETLETQHFLVFTDWDPREYAFLRENVENAYSVVSAQFNRSAGDNVFIGKLPIFMITSKSNFDRFTKDISRMTDAPKDLAGYYRGMPDGFGYMVMWKPDVKAAGGNVRAAEREWAHVLVHEFTHAFVARYRTDAQIPRWLGEGIAEVISSKKFPRAHVHAYVRMLAGQGKGIEKIFEDKDFNTFVGTDYPLAQTVVETLIAGDPKVFLRYFNDIKDGVNPDEALRTNYHCDRQGLESAWRKYVKTYHGN